MLDPAPRAQRTTHLVGRRTLFVLAVLAAPGAGACKKSDRPASRDEAPSPPPTPARTPTDAGVAGEPDARANRITISVEPPRAPGTALARRCALGGDPLISDCIGGGEGLALGADGTLYVVADREVRRYTRAEGEGCAFAPAGEPIALPPDNPRPQKVGGGPMFMRSGGAAWHVVRAGAAVYAYDFLGGLYRIDRGTATPACVDVFGYRNVAVRGKQLLVNRKGIERLSLGKAGACTASSAGIDDKVHGELYVIRDQLFVARSGKLARYDGTAPVALGEGTRICSVTSVTACGDGACVLDNNCMQLIQLEAGGAVLRTIDDDQLFGARPWSLQEAITLDDGGVLVHARHRDRVGGKETCEAAIYELPAAVFAR